MKRLFTPRRITILVALLAFFIFVSVSGIVTWEYTNSSAFCTTVCHDVHPEEPRAYQDFYHARVKCVECHMGRVSTLRAIGIKATHFSHLVGVLTGRYERPLWSVSMRPANESCERCHWPESFHDDSVRQIKHYASDEANSETRIYLIMHIGGGTAREGRGKGIHWHIENRVRYIATDEQKQHIPWVEVTFLDGRTVTYMDVANPLTPEEIAAAPKRTMDCVDCHNRVGHPFPSPKEAVDQAIALGRLDRRLPEVKARVMALLSREYASDEEALAAVEAMWAEYKRDYPEIAATYPEAIARAEEVMKELLARVTFEEPGVNWRSFPDEMGHKDFPGCFRCHDGKHISPEGEAIRLHCNICHSIPEVVGEDERPPSMPLSTIQEPEFHRATNFIADHRFQANNACAVCHGEVRFGYEDDSFCANPACHGTKWPSVNLDAAFPHPFKLEGKHAEAWCHECHNGARKPPSQCASCHQPPSEPHFGKQCEQCHTPAGFEQVDLSGFEHPVPLVGTHQRLACETCHGGRKEMPEYLCSNCHQPPEDHLGQACESCHTPEGWIESAASILARTPPIPHSLKGRDACLLCHAPESKVRPAPADHEGRLNEQCTLCHKVARSSP